MERPFHRLVVKIGSNVLTQATGQPNVPMLQALVAQLAWLKQRGVEVLVVSSGAVSFGRAALPDLGHLNPVLQRQIWSALGQPRLLQHYQEAFAAHHCLAAQILVTKEDFRDREHYLNMQQCLLGLLRDAVVPVLNENDTIAVTELMFTDNDELAGLVAAAVSADALVILSNVDGIFDGHPGQSSSRLIPIIDAGNSSQSQRFILPSTSSFGRGGMITKYRIARQAARLGVHAYIANGQRPDILRHIFTQEGIFTWFPAQKKPSNLKKRLAHHAPGAKATVHINAGAAAALLSTDRASSLLPVGIASIEGQFEKGDLIYLAYGGQPIATGRAQYGAATALRYLGAKGKKPLVHYDHLLIL